MLRIAVTSLFLALAVAVLGLAFNLGSGSPWGALWLNLGTEIVGIVFTVAIVEWLFERRRRREDARKMAWRVFHELDHAVWVWQGGHRQFDLAELVALLKSVEEGDSVPEFTQNLLMRLGSVSQDTLRHEPEIPASNRALEQALNDLAPLARIRDYATLLPAKDIAACLSAAADHLAAALRLSVPEDLPAVEKLRDPSAQRQEWRHYGKILGV